MKDIHSQIAAIERQVKILELKLEALKRAAAAEKPPARKVIAVDFRRGADCPTRRMLAVGAVGSHGALTVIDSSVTYDEALRRGYPSDVLFDLAVRDAKAAAIAAARASAASRAAVRRPLGSA